MMPHSASSLSRFAHDSAQELSPDVFLNKPVFVLASYSGAGKNTVAGLTSGILARDGVNMVSSASRFSTRSIRPGEVNGVDGYFVSEDEFDSLRSAGTFIYDYGKYGVRYGFSADILTTELSTGPVFVVGGEVNTSTALRQRLVSRGFVAEGVFISRNLPDILNSIESRAADSREKKLRRDHVIKSYSPIPPQDFHVIDNTDLSCAVDSMVQLVKSKIIEL